MKVLSNIESTFEKKKIFNPIWKTDPRQCLIKNFVVYICPMRKRSED
jgi:hypothetical protein